MHVLSRQGYNSEEDIEGLRDPHVAVHGSFSLMVNLHAVTRYFDSAGGSSVHSPCAEGFKVILSACGALQGCVAYKLLLRNCTPVLCVSFCNHDEVFTVLVLFCCPPLLASTNLQSWCVCDVCADVCRCCVCSVRCTSWAANRHSTRSADGRSRRACRTLAPRHSQRCSAE